MAKASWNQRVIAESTDTQNVDGNAYFPQNSLDEACFEKSSHTSVCGWKGVANYYHVVVEGKRNENAAWYYADPKPEAAHIKNHIAFWRGVTVESDDA